MEEERYAIIEDYLDNTLDASSRATFEAEVLADPVLAALLTQMREARTRLARQWEQQDADRALSATLKEAGRQYVKGETEGQTASAPRLGLRRWWPVAAAAACLAGFLIWFFQPVREIDLYAEYRQFPDAAFTTRAANDPGQANLAAVDAAFNKGQYAEALLQLQERLVNQPKDLEALFFAGLCQLELGQTNEAAETFQQLSIMASYADESTWYLALTLLKEKKRTQCMEVLRQIPSDSRNYARAQKLLGDL